MSKLDLKLEGDTTVVVTRRFAAPPVEVYRAHVDPECMAMSCAAECSPGEGFTACACI